MIRKTSFAFGISCFCLTLLSTTTNQVLAEEPNPNSTVEYTFNEHDWPWWRGPYLNGTANPNQKPPLNWSEDDNVLWKRPIPGRGHGSPILVNGQVYLLSADVKNNLQWLFSIDANTGNLTWQKSVHEGNVHQGGNKKATQASTSPACDGTHLFVSMLNRKAIYATCFDLTGNKIWERKISDYIVHQGYAASPLIYKHMVIVAADNKGGGAIAGLDRKTGKIVWSRKRPSKPNYPSPVIFNVAGRDQLFLTGCNLATSLDPLTGKTIWEIDGATTECVTSTVTDGKHIYTSGGYPKNHTAAILADGSGKVVWENKNRIYVPSMLIKDGFLYGVMDAGVAGCWNSATGKQMWKKRLGGVFSSSPALVGDKIFATNEVGTTFILAANPNQFELLGENQLGDDIFATPVFSNGQIYHRVAFFEGDKRQEYLYCLGSPNE